MDPVQKNSTNPKSPVSTAEGMDRYTGITDTKEKILDQTEKILDDLKDKSIQQEEEWMVYILVIPLSLIIIAAIVKWGVLWRFVPFVALCTYLVFYRWKMIKVTKEALKVKLPSEEELRTESVWLKSKINYLMSGLHVKHTRIRYISWLYFLFCPWLLYFVLELVKEPPQGLYFLTSIILAYLIGGIFWLFHFRSELEMNEKTRIRFENYKNTL